MIAETPGLAAKTALRNGAAPAWILEIPFASGTVYLSDRAFTVTNWATPAIVTLPWIASWGRIVENLSGVLAMPMVSGFGCDVIIDPKAATSIRDMIRSAPVEKLRCILYRWDEDLDASTDPPVPRWVGNIVDHEQQNELLYHLDLVDESVILDKPLGRVLSLADYPNAHLNDVGKQMTILYGPGEKIPALRLDVPKPTTLVAELLPDATSFSVSDAIVTAGDVLVIDEEEIYVNAVTGGKDITDCYRGYNGTGNEEFVPIYRPARAYYALCAAPNGDVYVAVSPGDIYVRIGGVGQFVPLGQTSRGWTGMCAAPNGDIYACEGNGDIYKRTAGAGNFVALGQTNRAWLGMAAAPNGNVYCSVFGGDIYMQTNGAGNFNALGGTSRFWYHMCADPSGNIYATVSGDIYKQTNGAGAFVAMSAGIRNWTGICFHKGDLFATVHNGDIYKQTAGAGAFAALGQAIRAWIDICATERQMYAIEVAASGDIYRFVNVMAVTHKLGSVVNIKDAPGVLLFLDHRAKAITKVESVDTQGIVTDVTANCTLYTGQSGDELAGYEGMAVITTVVNYLVGDRYLITGEGWPDDGSGTITGTPGALIERPDHIYAHLLYTYQDWPIADFVTDAAAAFAADGYKFSLPILDRKRLKELCAAMAFQCRCWFRFSGGKAKLTYRPDTLASAMTIQAGMTAMNDDYTTTRRVRPSPLDEVINVIHLYYKRDWTVSAGRSAYQAVLRDTHAASITAYGEKEKPDLFLFDYIRDDTMAADLLAFYLAQYPFRTDVVQQEVSMRCSALEFADPVTLAEYENLVGGAMEVGIAPGTKDTLDMISLTVRGAQP